MLVTLAVIDNGGNAIFYPALTIASEEDTIELFLRKKNVIIEDVVDIKIGTSIQTVTSCDLDCINDIKIEDLMIFKPCLIYVVIE